MAVGDRWRIHTLHRERALSCVFDAGIDYPRAGLRGIGAVNPDLIIKEGNRKLLFLASVIIQPTK